MATREELLQAAKDAKDQPKIDAAYEASLTSTEMAPKPEQKPVPKPTPKPKKMAGGGVTRADGIAQRGKTKGRMV